MVAPAAPVVAKELREKAVLGANIQKDGHDPPILADRLVLGLSFFVPLPITILLRIIPGDVDLAQQRKMNVEDHHHNFIVVLF